MLDIKRNNVAWVPVRLLDGAIPVTGIPYGDVQVTLFNANGDQNTISVNSGDWEEATVGALSGTGTYRLRIPGGEMGLLGFLVYVVAVPSPATKFVGSIQVVENLESDTFDAVSTIPASLSALTTLVGRSLGLMHENSVLDQTAFDGQNNLTTARLRTYNSKANAEAAGATGLQSTYVISATYSGKNVQTYTVVKEP